MWDISIWRVHINKPFGVEKRYHFSIPMMLPVEIFLKREVRTKDSQRFCLEDTQHCKSCLQKPLSRI